MLTISRKTPEQMDFYEVLMRRAALDNPVSKDLQSKYYNLRAGYAGERRVDHEWREVNVPGILLHDFTCFNEFGHSHQMDTIFICKHFVLVVEVKNVGGRIDFDDQRRQLLRTREDGTVESFMNPVDQVKRHRELLEHEVFHWPEYVPIEAVIVIANPSTVIGHVSNEVPIFNVSGLRSKVYELVKKHEQVSVNTRTVRGYLEKLYRPLQSRMRTIDVPVRKGVLCVSCSEVMVHGAKGFMCMKCGWRDSDGTALRQAMHDYRVLYGAEISNGAFRDFVGVMSTSTANFILKKLFTEHSGNYKARKYKIPENLK